MSKRYSSRNLEVRKLVLDATTALPTGNVGKNHGLLTDTQKLKSNTQIHEKLVTFSSMETNHLRRIQT
jgi:hypothetical protein